ncbi:hypothetical protein NEPAR05_2488 [Nematocida parisii]|nr:hypothetical protein NEPAR05_2488 [Nematocida parisii]
MRLFIFLHHLFQSVLDFVWSFVNMRRLWLMYVVFPSVLVRTSFFSFFFSSIAIGISTCSDKRKRAARMFILCGCTSSFRKKEVSPSGSPDTIESDPSAEGNILISCVWNCVTYSFFSLSSQISSYVRSFTDFFLYL